MPRIDIDRIREKIRLCQYDMSAHAMEEMAEDWLTILDVEAVATGARTPERIEQIPVTHLESA